MSAASARQRSSNKLLNFSTIAACRSRDIDVNRVVEETLSLVATSESLAHSVVKQLANRFRRPRVGQQTAAGLLEPFLERA